MLLVAFIASSIISKIFAGNWNVVFSGNLAMFIMLCLTTIGHFKFADGMTMMMPEFVPLKRELVYFTGIAEFVLGFALLFPSFRYVAGIILVVLFMLMLPANINAAMKHIDLQKADHSGDGPGYLWLRIPLQVFFIAWVWYFSVRH